MEERTASKAARRASMAWAIGLSLLLVGIFGGLVLAYGDESRTLSGHLEQSGDQNLRWFDVPVLAGHERLHVFVTNREHPTQLAVVPPGGQADWPASLDDASWQRTVQGSVEHEIRPDAIGAEGAVLVVAYPADTAPPSVNVQVRADPLLTMAAPVVFATGTLGAVLLLAAAAVGVPSAVPGAPPAPPGQSGMEAFLRLAVRVESWLLRTRRYLLLLGVFGILLWYPLVALFFFTTSGAGDATVYTWVSAGAAVLLVASTVRWVRRLRELDEELRAWRSRLDRLRFHEEEILAEP